MMFSELLSLLQGALWADCGYLFFVPVGIFATIWVDHQKKQEEVLDNLIQEKGIATEGLIIDHEKTVRHYYLVYRYENQGESYTQKQSVYPLGYESVSIGETVPIRFLSETPSLSLIIDIQKKNSYTRKAVSTLFMITLGYTSFVCFGVIVGVLVVYFNR
jgi:hypothetical protein